MQLSDTTKHNLIRSTLISFFFAFIAWVIFRNLSVALGVFLLVLVSRMYMASKLARVM